MRGSPIAESVPRARTGQHLHGCAKLRLHALELYDPRPGPRRGRIRPGEIEGDAFGRVQTGAGGKGRTGRLLVPTRATSTTWSPREVSVVRWKGGFGDGARLGEKRRAETKFRFLEETILVEIRRRILSPHYLIEVTLSGVSHHSCRGIHSCRC
jgi:hypothetical protein